MNKLRVILALATIAGGQTSAFAPAHAAIGLAFTPGTMALAATGLPSRCESVAQPAFGPALGNAATVDPGSMSKSQAILGGQVSKLDLIMRQQAGNPVRSTRCDAGAASRRGAGGGGPAPRSNLGAQRGRRRLPALRLATAHGSGIPAGLADNAPGDGRFPRQQAVAGEKNRLRRRLEPGAAQRRFTPVCRCPGARHARSGQFGDAPGGQQLDQCACALCRGQRGIRQGRLLGRGQPRRCGGGRAIARTSPSPRCSCLPRSGSRSRTCI